MSSPQLENGYTCIAHEILEALCKANLSPYESRVMWCILRKTYGHHKKTDRISLSQISQATELDKGNAGRALRSLKQRNIIAAGKGNQIGLQKDHEKWRAVFRETRGDVLGDTVSRETTKRCLGRQQTGILGDTTKDIKIKDSAKGKPSRPKDADPRIKEITDTWAALYLTHVGIQYHFILKDFGLFKSALRTFELPQLKELAAHFFENADRWVKEKAGFTVAVFHSKLNSLASTSKAILDSQRAGGFVA
jgi:phage replication O-like protein O